MPRSSPRGQTPVLHAHSPRASSVQQPLLHHPARAFSNMGTIQNKMIKNGRRPRRRVTLAFTACLFQAARRAKPHFRTTARTNGGQVHRGESRGTVTHQPHRIAQGPPTILKGLILQAVDLGLRRRRSGVFSVPRICSPGIGKTQHV